MKKLLKLSVIALLFSLASVGQTDINPTTPPKIIDPNDAAPKAIESYGKEALKLGAIATITGVTTVLNIVQNILLQTKAGS